MSRETEYYAYGSLRCSEPDDQPSISDGGDQPSLSDGGDQPSISDGGDQPSIRENESAATA